jgi:Tol biopolymer transport system component
VKASSGAGSDEGVLEGGRGNEFSLSWSPDGRSILYGQSNATGAVDLWVLRVDDRQSSPFTQTPFNEYPAVFSPDGRWVAYASDESGRNEVYVAPFPGPGGKWQVSAAGGHWPRWRRDGRELFFLAPDGRVLAAEVEGRGSTFEIATIRPLFQTQVRLRPTVQGYGCDVSPDGQRFLVNTLAEEAAPAPITLVVNWPALLKK